MHRDHTSISGIAMAGLDDLNGSTTTLCCHNIQHCLFFSFPFLHPYCCIFLPGKQQFVSRVCKVLHFLLLFSQGGPLPAPLIVPN